MTTSPSLPASLADVHPGGQSPATVGPVLYVLKRYPRLSETFVVREILAVEAAGVPVRIDALLPPEDGPRHPEVELVRAPVRYLPRRPDASDAGACAAHLRIAVRHPVRWARLARRRRAQGADAWRRFLQAGMTADRIRRERVTHVHAHFATAAAEVARDAAALAGVPYSVTVHAKDIYAEENAARLAERVAGVRTLVTISRTNVDHLEACLPGVDVRLVPNGLELPALGGPQPQGPVLCVARLVAKKGIDTLLEAVALLGPSLPELQLEIIGGGELADELQRRAAELGIEKRVWFRGPLASHEVAAAYRRCSMLALPCRVTADGDRDGIPTVMLEALGRGIPVVSTDVAGIGEVVRHEHTGLLVAPDDAHAFAAAVGRLWLDPDLSARLGAAGRALVAEHFDPTASSAALRRVFAPGGAA